MAATMLQQCTSSASVVTNMASELIDLYHKSLVFLEVASSDAVQIGNQCIVRFAGYDRIAASFIRNPTHDPSKWHLGLARGAARYCYRVEDRGDVLWELVTMIGLSSKVSGAIVKSSFS